MKCIVIYFSQTGNTEKIAKAIQIGVKQAADHCDILPIKEANPRRLYEYDLIGFGAPVMRWLPTPNVEAFIKNMRFVGGKHAFPFCTHNTIWSNFFHAIVPILRDRGLIVIGWGDWFGSAFGPLGQPTPYLTDGHPDEVDLQEAEAFGREMVERSKRISAGESSLIPEEPPPATLPEGAPPEVAWEDFESIAKRGKFRLIYDREKCLYPKCRLCMDNCPVDGIDLSVEPRVIGEPCMLCTAICDQLCPTGAIQVDEECMKEQARLDAETNFADGAIQRCRDYEAQGIFRRLVPEDKVSWENQIYKVYNKHPRFVIGKGRPYGIDPWSWRP